MKRILALLTALLLAPLVALHADEPAPVRDERVSSPKSTESSAVLMQRIMKAADKNKDGKFSLEKFKPLDVQARHHGDKCCNHRFRHSLGVWS